MFKIDDKVYCAFNPLSINGYDEDGNIVEGTVSEIETKTTTGSRGTVAEIHYRISVGLDSTFVKDQETFATYEEAKIKSLEFIDKELGFVEKRLEKLRKCRDIVTSR